MRKYWRWWWRFEKTDMNMNLENCLTIIERLESIMIKNLCEWMVNPVPRNTNNSIRKWRTMITPSLIKLYSVHSTFYNGWTSNVNIWKTDYALIMHWLRIECHRWSLQNLAICLILMNKRWKFRGRFFRISFFVSNND